MDETTLYSDLVLPDGTYLERWQDDHVEPGLGFPMFGLRSPMLEKPLYDTRNTGDVIIQMARRLRWGCRKIFSLERLSRRFEGCHQRNSYGKARLYSDKRF